MIPSNSPVFSSVKVAKEGHPRDGQAGYVVGTDPAKPDETAVKFDTDGAVQATANADLVRLS
jgi:hypothetical protein